MRAQISQGGAKRTHTLLMGEKLIAAWMAARKSPGGARFKPILWLRMEGATPHPWEKELSTDTLVLGESLMRDLAEAGSPPEHALVMTLEPEPTGPLAARVIIPWGIQDPGNLGAILRSAAAFGFQEALLGTGCTDPFGPKALRGSMGAAFLMPIRRAQGFVLDEGHWYALHGGPDAVPIVEADLSIPLRLMVGNEGHGWKDLNLPKEIQFLSIPISGVESLNAAVAAGIACFEAFRRG